jgi:heme exporter protein C
VSTRPSPSDSLGSLAIVAFILSAISLGLTFLYAPTERIEGDIQRMLYLHVPAAFTMYMSYGIVFFASLMYLLRREARWDELAASSAEVGTVFATIMIVTGPIWAKPVWGTYWVWDARLTSAFVLWLIFIGYLMLRSYGGHAEQVARYCAVLAIIGFADIPIIHYSVRWWRTLHPDAKIMTEGSPGQGLQTPMLITFAVAFVATFMVFTVLLKLRLRLERQQRRLDALQREITRPSPVVLGSTN